MQRTVLGVLCQGYDVSLNISLCLSFAITSAMEGRSVLIVDSGTTLNSTALLDTTTQLSPSGVSEEQLRGIFSRIDLLLSVEPHEVVQVLGAMRHDVVIVHTLSTIRPLVSKSTLAQILLCVKKLPLLGCTVLLTAGVELRTEKKTGGSSVELWTEPPEQMGDLWTECCDLSLLLST